jgi:hypothetical protein
MIKLSSKKWLLLFISFLIFVLGSISLINFFIDSSLFFSKDINEKYILNDNNTFKTHFLINNFKNKKTNLVLGSSRLQLISKKMIDDQLEFNNFYNYSNPGGTPLHHYYNLKFLLSNDVKINKIFLGLDYFSFTHTGDTKSYPFTIYPIGYQNFNKLNFNLYYLFSLNLLKQNLKSYFNYNNKKENSNIIFSDGAVVNLYDLEKDLTSPTYRLKDYKHENFSKTKILNSQLDALKKFLSLVNKYDIELTIFIPPPSYVVLKYYSLGTKLDIIKFITDNYDNDLIDFAYFNEITLHDRNFFDMSHMNIDISNKVMLELISKKKIGLTVNNLNFEDYKTFVTENFQTYQNK